MRKPFHTRCGRMMMLICLLIGPPACSGTYSGGSDASDTPDERDMVIEDSNNFDTVQEDVVDSVDAAEDVSVDTADITEDEPASLPVPRLEIRGHWLGVVGTDHAFRACFPTGELPRVPVNDALFEQMASGGRNLTYLYPGSGDSYPNSARFYVDGNFSNGIDENHLVEFENDLIAATENEVGVLVSLWETVELECDLSGEWRWSMNPWNADVGMGGPYDDIPADEVCGKRAWYTFEDYDTVVYNHGDPYPEGASMYIRGQWRQEEVIYHVASLLRDYPIAAVNLMWEAGDRGSHECGHCDVTWESHVIPWHRHMADYIKDISPGTLVSTGVGPRAAGQFIPAAHLDFLEDEGYLDRAMDGWCSEAPVLDVPAVWTGYNRVDNSGNNCTGTDWAGCNRDEAVNNIHGWIRQGWLCGFQPGTPFWEYRRNFSDVFDPYVLIVRAFLDTVATWEDEPGDELTDAAFPPLP